jgi:hypothetical protein
MTVVTAERFRYRHTQMCVFERFLKHHVSVESLYQFHNHCHQTINLEIKGKYFVCNFLYKELVLTFPYFKHPYFKTYIYSYKVQIYNKSKIAMI